MGTISKGIAQKRYIPTPAPCGRLDEACLVESRGERGTWGGGGLDRGGCLHGRAAPSPSHICRATFSR